MHIVIPIEIENREFDAKVWLAGMLAADQDKVTLGQNKIIHENLEHLDPNLFVGLSAVDRPARRERFQRLKEMGASIFVLDTEGGAFGSQKSFGDRVAPEILEYVDVYLAWGEFSAEFARESVAENDLSTEVINTGNPRFDLLHPDMASLYEDDAAQIRDEYGRFLLFNTNFTVNHVAPEGNQDKTLLEDMRATHKKQSRLLSEFVSVIYEIDHHRGEYTVVVRPHPGENPDTYRTLLAPYENVYVSKSGEVRPWILASEAVIHNSCTTGMETSLMKQPVISYLTEFYDDHISNELGYGANTHEEVIDILDSIQQSDTPETDTEYLQQFISNTEEKAAFLIRDAVRAHGKPDPSGSSVSDRRSINELLGRSLYRIDHGLYRSVRNSRYTPEYWTYVSYKCGILPLDEIRSKLEQFSEWYDRPVSVKRYDYTDNLFRIQPRPS
jgi:surface carbohydrate biosynthesis protein